MVTVWISGLPKGTSEEDLAHFLRKYGTPADTQIRSSSRDVFAFVTYDDEKAGLDAIKDLNETEFERTGIVIRLERSKTQPGRAHSTNRNRSRSRGGQDNNRGGAFVAWMGGLPRGVSEEEIVHFLRGYGKILEVRIRSSEKDVFAFATFADEELGSECVKALDQQRWSKDTTHVIQMRQSATRRPQNDKERYRSPTPRRVAKAGGSHRLNIRNLPHDMTWSELKDIAREWGETVSFSNVFVKSGVACGVVEYRDRDQAEHAYKQMHRRRMSGNSERLEVTWD